MATNGGGTRTNRRKNHRKVDLNEVEFKALYGVDKVSVPGLESFPRRLDALKLKDAGVICQDLGFVPLNLCDVGAWDEENGGLPVVARLYPLNRNELKGRYSTEDLPFPTMLWMTSSALKARVSKIEVDGYIEKFQDRLISSPEAIEAMKGAHEAYARERWDLLSESDKVFVTERGWDKSLKHVGVGGMRDFTKVKCLHTHTAHYLSRPDHGNILGQWTYELLLTEEYSSRALRQSACPVDVENEPKKHEDADDPDDDRVNDTCASCRIS